MQTFRTKTHELAFPEVPREATDLEMSNYHYGKQIYIDTKSVLLFKVNVDDLKKGDRPHMYLPEFDWKLLTEDCTKVTEEQAKIVCEEVNENAFNGIAYYDYAGTSIYDKSVDSFTSIVESLGLPVRNKLGTDPRILAKGMQVVQGAFTREVNQWIAAEKEVKRYAVLCRTI